MQNAILVFQCPDHKGIVAKISNYIFKNNCNIISIDEYCTSQENGTFFIRLEFCFNSKEITLDNLKQNFQPIAQEFNAYWQFHDKEKLLKMGILLSKTDHCLEELLYRWSTGELKVEIPFIISNHNTHQKIIERYNIPFYLVNSDDKKQNEQQILQITENSDFLVLARYMRILSPDFLQDYNNDIINIHHSFLPSFAGADPYQQAYDRGVKIIGSTAHFVTSDLDEGPIIEQLIEHVSHKDSVEQLKNKGKSLEKLTLAKAVELYLDHRIIRFKNKTIVFK
ncbi:formyltetrahydrofolate deformylase [Candidatus Margulisiibacteriota bacterium]